jgi:subtilisin family serine protease
VVHLVAPDAQIIPYRVVDTLGKGNGYHIAEAVYDAVSRGCKVINISLVMAGKHYTLDDAIEYARNRNVVVVAAVGNDSSDVQLFPAEDSHVLGVAAVDSSDHKSDFSNFGSAVDLVAPGEDIKGPFPDSSWARWKGTSFAAPFVTGTAALLFSLHPQATWSDVVDLLEQTALDLDPQNPAYAGQLGRGRIEPLSAVTAWSSPAGDVNGSGNISSSDIVFLVNYVFKSGVPPANPDNGDVDASCSITSSDIIYLINFVFKGGPSPLAGCVP